MLGHPKPNGLRQPSPGLWVLDEVLRHEPGQSVEVTLDRLRRFKELTARSLTGQTKKDSPD